MRVSEISSRVNALLDRAPHAAARLLKRRERTARRRATAAERAQLDLLRARTLNAAANFPQTLEFCRTVLRTRAATPETAPYRAQLCLEDARAKIFLGDADAAQISLERAQTFAQAAPAARVELTWRIEWLAARLAQERGALTAAAQRLETLRETVAPHWDALALTRLERDIGYAYSFAEPARAEKILTQAREKFETLAYRIDAALCDVWAARIHRHRGAFARARALYAQSRAVFLRERLGFYAAWCDLGLGWVEWGMNRLDAAIPALERARAFFIQSGAQGEAASCEINLASIYLERYQYDAALPLLERALKTAQAAGRRKQAAVCLLSMAWAYDHQGNYAQALERYAQARAAYPPHDANGQIVCDLYVGLAYFNLGQFSKALTILGRAARLARRSQAAALYAEAQIYRAQTWLALRRPRSAQRALLDARTRLTETGQLVYVAFCDRLLAQTYRRNPPQALARLAAARRAFQRADQPLESALCDLTQGELESAWGEWTRARRFLHRAQEQLAATHPDAMWRVEYGLGRIARACGKLDDARAHFLTATRHIAQLRANVRLEEWSNSIFGARQRVFDDALTLTRRAGAHETALEIIESGKAQLFAHLLRQREWRAADADQVELAARERSLRQELAAARGQLTVEAEQWQGALWGDVGANRSAARKMAHLKELTAAYDELVAQLQATRRGIAGAPTLTPFSLEEFRRALAARHGTDWAALDYYLVHDRLTIALVDAETVTVNTIRLDAVERAMLNACAGTHPELREHIYRGVLRGYATSDATARYLETLGAKLIPERVRAAKNHLTLIVSPHGILHQLPFHALKYRGAYLLDRFSFVYAPSFQVLTQLYRAAPRVRPDARVLLCGAAEFETRAPPLRHTRAEIRALAKQFGDAATVLWQRAATRENILALNRSGALARFDILHFATHAVVEPRAPHWSRILLAGDALTVADALDLNLNARLATLSACASALGAAGAGDELVGLARAFFYAGARALVASLWQVDDKTTGALMQRFYAQLRRTDSLADALRAAQLELRAANAPPFYWAPFMLMGAV